MRTRFSFLFASILLAAGCGSDDTETPATPADTGTRADATADTGAKTDSAVDSATSETTTTDTGTTEEDAAGIKCGDKVCGMGQVCCASGDPDSGFMLACATGSCPDGGSTISCDGPEDCPTGAKICCAEVKVEGSGLMCTFKTGVAECRGTCASKIPTGCPDSATVRRCHGPADCTESGYKKCCLFESGGTSAEFCASDLVALAAVSCK